MVAVAAEDIADKKDWADQTGLLDQAGVEYFPPLVLDLPKAELGSGSAEGAAAEGTAVGAAQFGALQNLAAVQEARQLIILPFGSPHYLLVCAINTQHL